MRSHVPLGSLSHYGKSSVNYPQCGEKGRAFRTSTHALARPAEARLAPPRCGDGAHLRAVVPVMPYPASAAAEYGHPPHTNSRPAAI